MPSTSGKQHRFMAMCAHEPEHANGKCPPRSVAEEYTAADRGKKFSARDQSKALRAKE